MSYERELLWHVGSSSRQFQSVSEGNRCLAGTLTAGLSRSIQASDQTMGHLEEEILHKTQDLERAVLEEAAQKKADQAPPCAPYAETS